MVGMLDYLLMRRQQDQDAQNQQAMMAAMFAGTPQDQVNITPQISGAGPSMQSLMMPSPQGPMPRGGVSSPMPGQGQPMSGNVSIPATATQPGQPMGGNNPQLALRSAAGMYNGPIAPMMQGPQADQLKALLSGLSPSAAMPVLSQILQNRFAPKAPIVAHEGDTLIQEGPNGNYGSVYTAPPKKPTFAEAPHTGINPATGKQDQFIIGNDGSQKWLSTAPGPKINFVNGQAVDENAVMPGTVIPQQAPQPTPALDPAAEAQRIRIAKAGKSISEGDIKGQLVDKMLKGVPLNANEQAVWDKLNPNQGAIDLTDPGDLSYIKSIANYRVRPASAGRNPAVRKAQIEAALTINPDYQEAKFDQAAKALRDFGTGKQGDTARSLDVSVAHLDTLRELGNALDNGNVTLINAAKQAFSEQFGVPAPTNFDAAKSIVADEVAKGVIGGQSAQADRETLAASLRKSGGPKVINGAIDTFQSLLGGQLGGLRKQYKRTTGANDFDEAFLSERTRQALEGGVKSPAAATSAPDAEGWTTLPNGVRIREKP